MSVGTTALTTEEFLDLAEEEGIERWMIRGELRERSLTSSERPVVIRRLVVTPGAPRVTIMLSGKDTLGDVLETVRTYLDDGVDPVWIANPFDFTVTVYRPGEEPVLYNRNQDLIGDPLLPGFRIRVAQLFQ